jgi:hypothetical protein
VTEPRKPALQRVKVIPPYRVVHDCRPYSDNAVAEVPEALADSWIKNGWAVPAE